MTQDVYLGGAVGRRGLIVELAGGSNPQPPVYQARRRVRCRPLTADQHGSTLAHVEAQPAALLSTGRSALRLIADEPLKPVAINDLSVVGTPGLQRERVHHTSPLGETVEPLVQYSRFGGTQKREQQTFNAHRGLPIGSVRSTQRDDAVEDSVSDGVWCAVSASKVLEGVQGQLTSKDGGVETKS
jgi:hypothetical protein